MSQIMPPFTYIFPPVVFPCSYPWLQRCKPPSLHLMLFFKGNIITSIVSLLFMECKLHAMCIKAMYIWYVSQWSFLWPLVWMPVSILAVCLHLYLSNACTSTHCKYARSQITPISIVLTEVPNQYQKVQIVRYALVMVEVLFSLLSVQCMCSLLSIFCHVHCGFWLLSILWCCTLSHLAVNLCLPPL